MRIAIVTGASSGLGAEYVRQLDIGSRLALSGDANYQLKGRFTQPLDEIWVIARREERLKQLKTEVRTPLRVLAMDPVSYTHLVGQRVCSPAHRKPDRYDPRRLLRR